MDILAHLASPVAILVSAVTGFYVGRSSQRRSELERRVQELEDRVWKFAQSAEEYWNLTAEDDKLRGFEIALKNLSTRIGSDIKWLKSNYSGFYFNNISCLSAFRRAAMRSPFEEKGRQPDPQRGDDIRRLACELIGEISTAKRFRWKVLVKDWNRRSKRNSGGR